MQISLSASSFIQSAYQSRNLSSGTCPLCGSPAGTCSCEVQTQKILGSGYSAQTDALSKDSYVPSTQKSEDSESDPKEGSKGAGKASGKPKELSPEEKQEIEKLKKRDAEVRAHEMAHIAAGGGVVRGGPSYEYQRGPDGRSYAIGGEVSIDSSGGKTPAETISKMDRVRASALAPANPSGQDLKVAAEAMSKQAEARLELSKSGQEQGATKGPESGKPEPLKPVGNQAAKAYADTANSHITSLINIAV